MHHRKKSLKTYWKICKDLPNATFIDIAMSNGYSLKECRKMIDEV